VREKENKIFKKWERERESGRGRGRVRESKIKHF
jgi:hypothetical protein